MTRVLLAVCTAFAIGGAAGIAWFWRWLQGVDILAEIPDAVPQWLEDVVWSEDGKW